MNKSPNSSDYRHKCVYSCLILDDIICVVPSCCTKIENHWLLFSHFMRNENPQEPVVYFMVLLTLAIVIIIIMNYSYMSPSWQLEWLMSSYYHDNNFNNRESIFLVISDIPINIMIPSNVYIYIYVCIWFAFGWPNLNHHPWPSPRSSRAPGSYSARSLAPVFSPRAAGRRCCSSWIPLRLGFWTFLRWCSH